MLYVYHHKVTGELLLQCDAEGREEILNSLKWAVKELDHEFLLPDTELTAGLSPEWQPFDLSTSCLHRTRRNRFASVSA